MVFFNMYGIYSMLLSPMLTQVCPPIRAAASQSRDRPSPPSNGGPFAKGVSAKKKKKKKKKDTRDCHVVRCLALLTVTPANF